MKTKYFRFLYFGRKECLLHVGEIEDTRTGETLTFLYLDGSGQTEPMPMWADENHARGMADGYVESAVIGETDAGIRDGQGWKRDTDQMETRGYGEISYPGMADVLVVGDVSGNTELVLEEILTQVTVGTVVYPRDESLNSVIGRFKIEKGIMLSPRTDVMDFQVVRAGWELHAVSLEEGSVVLLHGFRQRELFDDCVMNVSVLDGLEHRGWWQEKDGFAAAMRCTVHHDYDACRYMADREKGEYRIAALLYGQTHLSSCLTWIKSQETKNHGCEWSRVLRFLSLPSDGAEDVWDENVLDWIPEGYKCYYIGGPGAPSGKVVSQICRKNPYQIPAVTGEGTGLCCAGFLKYVDDKKCEKRTII